MGAGAAPLSRYRVHASVRTSAATADLGQADGAGDEGGGHLPAVGGVAQQRQAVHPVGRGRSHLCRNHRCAVHPQDSPRASAGSGRGTQEPPSLVLAVADLS